MKCQVLIDWLTFSIKNIQEPTQVIRKFLGLDPALFQEAPYGLARIPPVPGPYRRYGRERRRIPRRCRRWCRCAGCRHNPGTRCACSCGWRGKAGGSGYQRQVVLH